MKTIELKGELRENIGKKSTKALRADGNVPCVLYGGEKNVHFFVSERSLKDIIYTPHVYIIELNIAGTVYNAVLQDSQFHPVNDKALHLDFLEVKEEKPVKIAIPVALHGFAEGVKQGGKLNLTLRRLMVKGLSKDLPDQLDINIEKLTLGKSIKVGELSFDNLELLDSKNDVVVSVKLTRAARGAMLEAANAEAANSEE